MSDVDEGSWIEGRALHYIDPDSSEPLFQQVRRFLEQSLREGRFRANRPLPSSRHLAGVLGVSRNTVSAAYQELTALGLVESRPRSGLYLVPTTPTPSMQRARLPSALSRRARVDWDSHLIAPLGAELPPPLAHQGWLDYPYPFLPGQPDLRQFPVRGWLRALNEAMAGPHIAASLRDSSGTDDELLVAAICREILPPRGMQVSPDNVIVTSGAQEALFLLGQLFVGEGSVVGVENPGYVDAWHIFRNAGARLRAMPVDASGVVVTKDDAADLDLLYVTPSHHHPTSVTVGYARRAALLRHAVARDVILIEDDFNSEVRFRGRPTPSLKSMDETGRVVYVGTFSKFVAPGIRLGFIVTEPEVAHALRELRRYVTRHPSGQTQRALGLFIDSGEYHRVLRQHRRQLARKWEVLVTELDQQLPFPLSPVATGGPSIWVTGPEEFDGTRTASLAARRGVLVDPGAAFFLQDVEHHHMRVGFMAIPIDRIPEGVRRLGRAVREQLAGAHPS